MPRHSVRKSISRPFLPIKHALLVRSKTERGISSDSPSVTLARALVESALSHSHLHLAGEGSHAGSPSSNSSSVMYADADPDSSSSSSSSYTYCDISTTTTAASATSSSNTSDSRATTTTANKAHRVHSTTKTSDNQGHDRPDNKAHSASTVRVRQTSSCSTCCTICNDGTSIDGADKKEEKVGEEEEEEEEFSFDLSRPMGKARLSNRRTSPNFGMPLQIPKKKHTRKSKSLDLSSLATKLVRRASSISLRTDGMNSDCSVQSGQGAAHGEQGATSETSDTQKLLLSLSNDSTTIKASQKEKRDYERHRPRSKSISVLPSATTSSALSTICESTDEDDDAPFNSREKDTTDSNTASLAKQTSLLFSISKRRSRAGSMLAAIPEADKEKESNTSRTSIEASHGLDSGSGADWEREWEILSLRRRRRKSANNVPAFSLVGKHQHPTDQSRATRIPSNDVTYGTTEEKAIITRHKSPGASDIEKSSINSMTLMDASCRFDTAFPASPSTALDIWTASLYETIASSTGHLAMGKEASTLDMEAETSRVQSDVDDSGFASLCDPTTAYISAATPPKIAQQYASQRQDVQLTSTPPAGTLPRIPTLALISPMGTLRRYISCPDGILARSESGIAITSDGTRLRGRSHAPHPYIGAAVEPHQQQGGHHKQESSVNTFRTARSQLSRVDSQDLWPPPRDLFAGLFNAEGRKEPGSICHAGTGARTVSKHVSFSPPTTLEYDSKQRLPNSRVGSTATVISGAADSVSKVQASGYLYDPLALDARSALQLLPRDLNTDLEVKPWMVVMPKFVLDDLAVGVRDWDKDRLEASQEDQVKARGRSV